MRIETLRIRRTLRLLAMLLIVLIAERPMVYAQSGNTIEGVVLGSDGLPMEMAHIRISDETATVPQRRARS